MLVLSGVLIYNFCIKIIISMGEREMKKKLYIIGVTAALACALAGCGKKDTTADAGASVKDDVIEFVNVELPTAKADHDSAIATYNAYFADGSNQDLATYKDALQNTAIPTMEKCITTISGLETETDEVKALKDTYLQSVQKEYEAMKMVVSAIDGENADYLTQADSLISEAASLMNDYQTQLQTIANEQGIVVNQ